MRPVLIVFAMLCFLPGLAVAQTQPGKATATAVDTVKAKAPAKSSAVSPPAVSPPAKRDSSTTGAEQELETIAIEAIIEKPNVDIIPTRVAPELEEMEFVERSFAPELKEVPKDLLLDDDLDRVARLEGLKKLLEKKKKDK